jgi:hypothetical protein
MDNATPCVKKRQLHERLAGPILTAVFNRVSAAMLDCVSNYFSEGIGQHIEQITLLPASEQACQTPSTALDNLPNVYVCIGSFGS